MAKFTRQMKLWDGEFGKEYTNRNILSLREMESLYKKWFGITRAGMNQKFLKNLSREMRILEVGSNIGSQLLCLQKMGFLNLYGIELQSYAAELSKKRTRGINIIRGSAFEIPFKDNFFDLVFTSGLLIHIGPSDINEALDEIYRCTRKYIWGYEYYADKYTEVVYHGHRGMLWKTDFAKLFLKRFPDLKLIKEKRFKYLQNENIDTMFLLKKG